MDGYEFITEIKSRGGMVFPVVSMRAIELTQSSLQQMRSAILPMQLIEFYQKFCGGIMLGDANIFGPEEINRPLYSVPDITSINREISGIPAMRWKTLFGRNSLFWFAFDASGKIYMLDIINLSVAREYDDIFKAMKDCLVIGKI